MLHSEEKKFIYRQPNSDNCFICGRKNPHGLYMHFYDDGDKTVLATHTVPEAYQGYPGVVHGGIVAAMLDEAVGRVAMIGDPHHFMMSVKLEVKYRHPVPTEKPLRIIGRIERLRGRLGKAVGELILPDGTIAAEAAMTLADVPQEILVNADLDALGWYVDEQTAEHQAV
jgi:acyl-coenzyme A thioesterase PaaI-like protein